MNRITKVKRNFKCECTGIIIKIKQKFKIKNNNKERIINRNNSKSIESNTDIHAECFDVNLSTNQKICNNSDEKIEDIDSDDTNLKNQNGETEEDNTELPDYREMTKKDIIKYYLTYTATACIITITTMMLVRTFIIEQVGVSGNSMYPTIEDGDREWMDKITYKIKGIDRFDIVILTVSNDSADELGGRYLIKRVIGLPGERIRMDIDGSIYINGELLDDPYFETVDLSEFRVQDEDTADTEGSARYLDVKPQERIENTGNTGARAVSSVDIQYESLIVPVGRAYTDIQLGEDEYFVLGDNRRNSTDSRFSIIGNVNIKNIKGRIIEHDKK